MYRVEQNALVHYGVKGQKWGVRKYQNEDGTLTQLGKEHYGLGNSSDSYGKKSFERVYTKESKKLQKWVKRSDIDLQKEKAEEYTLKAKKAAKAALAGVATAGASLALPQWKIPIEQTSTMASIKVNGIGEILKQPKVTKDIVWSTDESDTIKQLAFLGSAAFATGATATGAAYAIKAAKAKKYTSIMGHQKAVARRDAQYKKLSNMVKDTPYMALFKDQIEAYKKEHPNSELTDKQIMKNLM